MKKGKSQYYRKANKFIFSNKSFYKRDLILNLKQLRNDSESQIEKFNKKNKQFLKEYEILKNDSDKFIKGYKRLENRGNEDELFNNHLRVLPFMKLITIYKNKGYKVPQLTSNYNLFKPNILFQDNDEIKRHFMLNKFGYNEKKEFKYLNKLNSCIREKRKEKAFDEDSSLDLSSSRQNKTISNSKNSFSLFKLNNPNNKPSLFNLKKENNIDDDQTELIIKYNENLKEIISNIKPNDKSKRRKSMYPSLKNNLNNRDSMIMNENSNQTRLDFRFSKRPSTLTSKKKISFSSLTNIKKGNIKSRNKHIQFKNNFTSNSTTFSQQSIFGKDNSINNLIDTSGGVKDCIKIIKNTQKIVNNYDFSFRKKVHRRNIPHINEYRNINTIEFLDKKINHLDKDIIYSIEKFKTLL